MEKFLVALDDSPGSLKSIHYLNRILKGVQNIQFILFHVLPKVSPDLLKRTEVESIERLHGEQPSLSGYFWTTEDEQKMHRVFQEALQLLLENGFGENQIRTRFEIQSAEVANIIVKEAKTLNCSTIVIGRRGVGRIKEFFLGSVSNSVTKLAREKTIWVVD